MILLPQPLLREAHAVFRPALPKGRAALAAATVQILSGKEGVRVRLVLPEIALECHHPTPSEAGTFLLPFAALSECEGRGNAVQIQSASAGKIRLGWERGGIPFQREYQSPAVTEPSFPARPARDLANSPSLLRALGEAMQIPTGSSSRFALSLIQLRGQQGDIVATDGRQLLIQGGFRFPWKEPLLIPRSSVFSARELPQGQTVIVGASKTHVFFRIGGWTIALLIETSSRFPKVDQVIPSANDAIAKWKVDPEEASALADMLDQLPGAHEEGAPITLDLGKSSVVRTRGENETRSTELALPGSRLEGKPVRLATDRRYLQRALALGFRTFLISAAEQPILCQEGSNVFVWVPLSPEAALAPQRHAQRIVLAVGGKSHTDVEEETPEVYSIPSTAAASPRIIAPVYSLRLLSGFLASAKELWDLVRKHHFQDRAK